MDWTAYLAVERSRHRQARLSCGWHRCLAPGLSNDRWQSLAYYVKDNNTTTTTTTWYYYNYYYNYYYYYYYYYRHYLANGMP